MIGPRFPSGAREAFVHPELIHTVLRMPSAPCHAPVPGVGICCRLPTSGESEARILSEQSLIPAACTRERGPGPGPEATVVTRRWKHGQGQNAETLSGFCSWEENREKNRRGAL